MAGSTESGTIGSTTVVMDKTATDLSISPPPSAKSDEDIERHAASTQMLRKPPTRPMFSKQFLQRGDSEVAIARAIYIRAYLSGLGMVIITIFVVFTIYWGSLWKVPARELQGWVVDFDGGDVGRTVVQGLTSSRTRVIRWEVVSSERFPMGVQDVIHALNDDQVWVAITVNEGASLNLQKSLASPNPAYDGTSAITAYGVEARNENAYRNFIRPIVQTSLDIIKVQYAIRFASQLSTSSPDLASLLSISPQTVVNPIAYSIVNLLPFNQPVASAVAFVGLIYLLILSFFIVMVAHGAREASGVEGILQLRSLISLRLASSCFGYFFLSFFYSLLNLAFKLDVWGKYGRAGFLIFWMLNWIGMLSVGLALESLITILTPQFIPFFMILWIIVNVSVCVFPIDILPRIYHYGYAAPFYNISMSIRSIVFGTKNTRLNFGILLIWVFISCITLPILQWFVRRKEIWRRISQEAAQADAQARHAPPTPNTTYDTLRQPDTIRGSFNEKRALSKGSMSDQGSSGEQKSVLDAQETRGLQEILAASSGSLSPSYRGRGHA